jgi:hypothetical protein
MALPDHTGFFKLLYDRQTLIAGGLAIVAAIIGAIAAYRVGRAQIIAAKHRDRLQARGIAVGVYPELWELQVLHKRALIVIEQWSAVDRRIMNTTTLVPAILNARIGLTPLLSRNIDNLFLVQPGAASLQQVFSFTLQYNKLVETLAQQVEDNVNSFEPLAHQQALSGNLRAIGMALEDALREIGPIHDEATSVSSFP